jgi:hypothetical protein
MCRRIPNLETAIEECRQLGKRFDYKYSGKHIKFYIEGRMIMLGLKKSNPDKVRKDIRRGLTTRFK